MASSVAAEGGGGSFAHVAELPPYAIMNWATAPTASTAPGLILDSERVAEAALRGTCRLSSTARRFALIQVICPHRMLAIPPNTHGFGTRQVALS